MYVCNFFDEILFTKKINVAKNYKGFSNSFCRWAFTVRSVYISLLSNIAICVFHLRPYISPVLFYFWNKNIQRQTINRDSMLLSIAFHVTTLWQHLSFLFLKLIFLLNCFSIYLWNLIKNQHSFCLMIFSLCNDIF